MGELFELFQEYSINEHHRKYTFLIQKREFKLYVFTKCCIDFFDELRVLNLLFKKHKLANLGWSDLEVCKEPFKSFYLNNVYTFRSRKEM